MSDHKKRNTNELSMPVWQFVRLMVELEKNAGNPAFRAWKDVWRELDRRLEKLGKADSKAYSALMMDTDVTLTGVTDPLRRHLDQGLGRVVDQIKRRLAALDEKDPGQRDLNFELKGLRRLRRDLNPPRGDDQRSPERKSVEQKPASGKPAGERPSSGKPSGARPASGKPSGARPASGKPSGGKPSGGRPSGGRPSGGRPSGGKPSGARPASGRPSNRKPT